MKKIFILLIIIVFGIFPVIAQNVAITDDPSYHADTSAMLDVKSTSKGILIPRVTTTQRNAIQEPATGLLVFDTDSSSFFFYNETGWVNLSHGNASGVWQTTGSNLFTPGGYSVGINNPDPLTALEVKANSSSTIDPLFLVINDNNDTVFAVYPNSVQISIDDKAKGNIGGFAVSGRSASKADKPKYLEVTPSSTNIFIDTSAAKGNIGGFAVSGRSATKANAIDTMFVTTYSKTQIFIDTTSFPSKGNIGGFAVSGRSASKGAYNEYLSVTPDCTRVFFNKKASKGNIGGFAVSGRSATKGVIEDVFVTTADSTRIYIDEASKGNIGGFAVSGRSATKETVTPFMDLTSENYFIGHESGTNNALGLYNSFFGYQSGKSNVDGSRNVFMGKETGLNNEEGVDNVFIGYRAGYNNIGYTNDYGASNVFIGTQAGFNNRGSSFQDWAKNNVFIGTNAGYGNVSGPNNVFIGSYAGYSNLGNVGDPDHGAKNVFMGTAAGYNNQSGYSNVYIGEMVSYNNTSGNDNVIIGKRAADNPSSGNENTIIGKEAGMFLDGGNQNVFIGADAGRGLSGINPGTGNIFIGYGAGYYETDDYKFIVQYGGFAPLISGDLSTGDFDVGGDVDIGGALMVNTSSSEAFSFPTDRGSNGQVLTTDGTGGTSWSTTNGSTASNGLNIEGTTTELGGILNENTKISQGNYSMTYDLTGLGNFYIQDNGTLAFIVANDGNVGIGTATPDYALQVDGNIVPETHKNFDLGTSSLSWYAVYASQYLNKLSKYFRKEEIIDILTNQKLNPSTNGQIEGNAFPAKLKNEGFISVGETASFNLQANQYQQEIINKQQQEIEALKKQIHELKALIESK